VPIYIYKQQHEFRIRTEASIIVA